jgi:hypothetical protein
MKDKRRMSNVTLIAAVLGLCGLPLVIMSQNNSSARGGRDFDEVIQSNSREFMEQGRKTFRFDTFGDEAFWGDSLKLHQAIAGSGLGGVGPASALIRLWQLV